LLRQQLPYLGLRLEISAKYLKSRQQCPIFMFEGSLERAFKTYKDAIKIFFAKPFFIPFFNFGYVI